MTHYYKITTYMNDNANILKLFNDHFIEFLDDLQDILPENGDILSVKGALLNARKTNPRLIIKIWKEKVVDVYRDQINKGDMDFFIEKNYENDISDIEDSNKMIKKINVLKSLIRDMNEQNQITSMKYIQNLTKISDLYN
jgi:hypothetical protein